MSALAVYLYRHGRVLLAWGLFISAAGVFYAAIDRYGALSTAGSLCSSAMSSLVDLASAVPSRVNDVSAVIQDSLEDSNGWGQWLWWLSGMDVLYQSVVYVVAQISGICTAVVSVMSAAIAFAGIVWIARKAQRWIKVTSGGDLNVEVVD